eukprot:3213914-Rhodomonas_salina.1
MCLRVRRAMRGTEVAYGARYDLRAMDYFEQSLGTCAVRSVVLLYGAAMPCPVLPCTAAIQCPVLPKPAICEIQ